jgi:Arc/MetJ family transcription regulator
MAKTRVDVDEDLLAEATTALGTVTKKDTVNSALRFADLQQIADDGGFDFDKLGELDR